MQYAVSHILENKVDSSQWVALFRQQAVVRYDVLLERHRQLFLVLRRPVREERIIGNEVGFVSELLLQNVFYGPTNNKRREATFMYKKLYVLVLVSWALIYWYMSLYVYFVLVHKQNI